MHTNRQLIVKLLSALINLITCLVAAVIVLYRQNWFGEGDVYAFLFWTIPFALALSLTGSTILNLFQKAPVLLRLFLIVLTAGLLSFGWVYSVALILGPWMNAFSIPVFYLWVVGSAMQLLFLNWGLIKPAESPKISKVILGLLALPVTLLVIVAGMILISFATSYINRPQKVLYLIPEGYKGRVLVIFNQPTGAKPEYENGRRVYRIPSTGILFTQLKDEEGIVDEKYFCLSATGKRHQLGVLDTRDFNEEYTTTKNPHEPPRDSLAVFNPGTMGSMNGQDNKNSKVFLQLSVGTYNEVRGMEDFNNGYIDSLQNAGIKKGNVTR